MLIPRGFPLAVDVPKQESELLNRTIAAFQHRQPCGYFPEIIIITGFGNPDEAELAIPNGCRNPFRHFRDAAMK